jgi:hypothetical protein
MTSIKPGANERTSIQAKKKTNTNGTTRSKKPNHELFRKYRS